MTYPEIPLPRLLNASGGTERFIRPISVDINEKITPLSYASMTLPQEESVPGRAYVELFTTHGSAGVYRVTSPSDAYGEDTTTCQLEHAITEVGDWMFGEEFSEMVPPHGAIERLWGHYRGSKWKLDANSMTVLGTDQIALDVSYRSILEGILGVLEQIPDCMMVFDFTTSPKWTFGFAKRGTSIQAEGRLSRNVTSATVTYDDSSLCTRAFYQYSTTDSDGNSETHWTHKDADSASKNAYGIVERTVSTGSDYDANEAEYIVDLYLAKHKKPLITVSIEAVELSSITGESLDTFNIGKKFRLALPDYNETVEDVITELSWSGLYTGFEKVTVTLGDQEDGVVTFLHDVDSSGGSSSGGGAAAKASQQEKKQSEFESRINKTDDTISMLVGFSSVSSSNIHYFQHKADFPDADRGVAGDIYFDRSTGTAYKLYNGRYIQVKLTDNGDGTYYVGAGGITTEIDNRGIVTSTVDADKVIIGRLDNEDLNTWAQDAKDGTGVFTKFLTVKKLKAQEIETMFADIGDARLSKIWTANLEVEGQALITDGLYVNWGVKVSPDDGSTYWPINLSDAAVDGNTLKIWKVGDAANNPSINFSKAIASWTAGWSGGTFTAKANPQNQSISTQIVQGTASLSGKAYTVPIEAIDSDNPNYQYATGRSVYINASTVYNNGWAAAQRLVSMPAAAPTGQEQTSFVVKVPPSTVDGSAADRTFTLQTGTPAASGYVSVSYSNRVVGRIQIGNWYTAGQQSVSVPKSAIHVDPIGWYGTEPTTDAEASTLGSYVQNHSSGWVRFDVYLDGYGSPSKSYRFKIG